MAKYLLPDHTTVVEGAPAFDCGDLHYMRGPDFLTADERVELGIVLMQPEPDERYVTFKPDPNNLGAWLTTPVDPAILKQNLAKYAALARFNREVAGTTVNGITLESDRESQAMLTGAYNMAQQNPALAFQWKTSSGVFVQLAASDITAMAAMVGTHVQTCFNTEASVVAQINTGTITTYEAVDAAFAAIP